MVSNEEMNNGRPCSLRNDEQTSNKVGVEHQPDWICLTLMFDPDLNPLRIWYQASLRSKSRHLRWKLETTLSEKYRYGDPQPWWRVKILHPNSQHIHSSKGHPKRKHPNTSPKFNIVPENRWLEDNPFFLGFDLNFSSAFFWGNSSSSRSLKGKIRTEAILT